jgi:hypothetical protein
LLRADTQVQCWQWSKTYFGHATVGSIGDPDGTLNRIAPKAYIYMEGIVNDYQQEASDENAGVTEKTGRATTGSGIQLRTKAARAAEQKATLQAILNPDPRAEVAAYVVETWRTLRAEFNLSVEPAQR